MALIAAFWLHSHAVKSTVQAPQPALDTVHSAAPPENPSEPAPQTPPQGPQQRLPQNPERPETGALAGFRPVNQLEPRVVGVSK